MSRKYKDIISLLDIRTTLFYTVGKRKYILKGTRIHYGR